jgi:UDP-N-acetyl-D-mannosaminuronate dehydrogenase
MNYKQIEEEANEKFFSIEPNPGQKKRCDICEHDHVISANNKNSGKNIKLFYRQKIKELMLEWEKQIDEIIKVDDNQKRLILWNNIKNITGSAGITK